MKEVMRKSYLRGTRLKIFFAILFVLFSIASTISLYKDYMRSAEVQYKEGKQFPKVSWYTFIKVEALEELDITDDSLKDKDIYSRVDAIFERGSKGRKNISPELKEKFKNAAEHSSLIRARVSDIVNEIVIKKSVDDYSSKLREKPFTSQFYLTVPGKGYYFLTYAVEVVILLITFFSVKSVIKNIRKNKAEYEELFIKYPETERDLDILVREAKYINKKLKVLIYKDALILYGKGFNFQLLSGFSKITFGREIRKGRVVSYIAHFHNNFETDEKVKICSNYKNSREDIDELGKTLKQTFGKIVRYNF